MKLQYYSTSEADMGISPQRLFSFAAICVFISNIHSSHVSNFSIDNRYFTMVSKIDGKRKSPFYRKKGLNLSSSLGKLVKEAFFSEDRTHVVIEELYFNSLLSLTSKHIHQGLTCSIMVNDKGFNVDAFGGSLHVLQHILEQILSPAINLSGGGEGKNTFVAL